MFSYIYKGWYAGGALLSRALRSLIGTAGIAVDVVCALFWLPNFTSYWTDNVGAVTYEDGTKVALWQGFFGWWGILLGYAIGCPVGAAIGAAIYIPDLILKGIIDCRKYISEAFYKFGNFVHGAKLYEGFIFFLNSRDHAGNIFINILVATLGGLMALCFLPITRAIEFFIPIFDNKLSQMVKTTSSVIVIFVGVIMCIVGAVPVYLLHRTVDLIEITRNNAFTLLTIIMGKFAGHFQFNVNNDEYMTSKEFVAKMYEYHDMTWVEIVFGVNKSNNGNPVVSNNGNPVVSNNGNPVVSNNGNPVVSNNGNSVVLNNGNSVVLNNGNSVVLNNGNSVVLNNGNRAVSNNSNRVVSNNSNRVVSNNSNRVVSNNGNQTGSVNTNANIKVSQNSENKFSFNNNIVDTVFNSNIPPAVLNIPPVEPPPPYNLPV